MFTYSQVGEHLTEIILNINISCLFCTHHNLSKKK
jgi:hypothetical protein